MYSKGLIDLVVLGVAIGRLDVVADKVAAANNLANQEEGIGLSSDKTSPDVLLLGDVLPCVGGASILGELQSGLLGSLKLSSRGRGHTLTDVDLLGNLTSNLGIVQDRA